MAHVCEELERRALRLPVIIGGATTSNLHTAVKIAPVYSGLVIHSPNASRNSQILAQLLGPDGQLYADKVRADQQALRATTCAPNAPEPDSDRRGPQDPQRRRPHLPVEPLAPRPHGLPRLRRRRRRTLYRLELLLRGMGSQGTLSRILDHPEKGAEARKVFADAEALLARIRDERLLTLQAAVGIFPARAEGDDIWITDQKGRERRLAMLRNQTRGEENRSLADCIAPHSDWIGCFAVTAGIGLRELCEKFRAEGDDYGAIMAKLLADRLDRSLRRSRAHVRAAADVGLRNRRSRPLPGRSSAANTAAAGWRSAIRRRPTTRSSARSSTCWRLS
ncbi:MAG: vitamin B12 dependent-methionine synthase activation domain-containing protein [Alistipes finegoldii]